MDYNISTETIDALLNKLKRNPVKDPFSLESKVLDYHSTSAYSLAMLKQLKDYSPSLHQKAKNEILGYIDISDRELFFEHLMNNNLFINGVVRELIFLVVSKYINISPELTVLYSLSHFNPLIVKIGNFFGMSYILDKITKVSTNLSSGVLVEKISPEEYKEKISLQHDSIDCYIFDDITSSLKDIYYFRYKSKKEYIEHISSYFGNENFDDIEKRNFMTTLVIFKMIPFLFENFFNYKNMDIDGYHEHSGKLLSYRKFDDGYYFVIEYKPIPLLKRLFNVCIRKTKMKKSIKDFSGNLKRDFHFAKSDIEDKVKEYTYIKKLVRESIELSIERLEDIFMLDKLSLPRIHEARDQLIKKLEEIDYIHPLQNINAATHEYDIFDDFDMFNFDINTNNDMISMTNKLLSLNMLVASIKNELNKFSIKLYEYETTARDLIIDTYRNADDKNLFLQSLLDIVNLKDTSFNHSYRVSELTGVLCEHWNKFNEPLDIKLVKTAALYHDIGKIITPKSILHKPDKLDIIEWMFMRNHAANGAKLLAALDFPEDIVNAAYYHHEYWDGSKGYPRELSGKQIPLMARMIAYIDALDAIAASQIDRKYDLKKQGNIRNYDDAIDEIYRCIGTQFDPSIKSSFDLMVSSGFIKEYYEKLYAEK